MAYPPKLALRIIFTIENDALNGELGDFDADCAVDFADYVILTNYWLTDELLVDIAPTPAGDGIVDQRDLDILCENWLFGK